MKFDIQPNERQMPKPYAEAQQDLQQYRTEHSKHLDVDAWAFGGNRSGTSYLNSGVWWLQGFSNTAVTAVYSDAQTALESVDAKIGKLLKENNITWL